MDYQSVAREVANRNVRVNAIAPGMIESDMTAVLSDKVKDAMLAQIPMKQFGQAEQVAEVTAFLELHTRHIKNNHRNDWYLFLQNICQKENPGFLPHYAPQIHYDQTW